MLELKNIKLYYKDYLDFHFNLNLEAGKSLGIIGLTGSGKSTLLNLIAGFVAPTTGEILFRNNNINDILASKRPVNMLFQKNNIFEHLNVFDNVALGISPSLKITNAEKLIVEEALCKVKLDGFNSRFSNKLNEGQQNKIAIARILVRKQPILLLDEPFTTLDPPMRSEMLELIKFLQQENDLTTLMVTHNYKEALLYCDKICFIDDGKIIHINEAKKFAETTKHPIINSYINSL
jgi:thiamine transport system ATP-binding protein